MPLCPLTSHSHFHLLLAYTSCITSYQEKNTYLYFTYQHILEITVSAQRDRSHSHSQLRSTPFREHPTTYSLNLLRTDTCCFQYFVYINNATGMNLLRVFFFFFPRWQSVFSG